jgi:hypothetical protein
MALAFGFDFPYTTFLFDPNDRFADYFKGIFSLPGAGDLKIDGTSKFSLLLSDYLHSKSYLGVEGLATGALTNLHSTPMGTLIGLVNLQLMHYFDPIYIFVSIFVIGLALLYIVFRSVSVSRRDSALFFAAALFCYPTLFMITRGHIYSGISSLSLLIFVLLMYQDKNRCLALLFLAVAVNLRPNAVIFISLIGLVDLRNVKTDLPLFFGLFVYIFLTSYFVSNAIYSDYTLKNFLLAVYIYHNQYVVGHAGLAFGSSLFGPLKAIFGYSKFVELFPILVGGSIIVSSYLLLRYAFISKIVFIFNICSSYVLASSVIADYHLLIFFAPLLCLYLDVKAKDLPSRVSVQYELPIIFLASILLLSPKNYVYFKSISAQVALNPIILICSSCLLIFIGIQRFRRSTI